MSAGEGRSRNREQIGLTQETLRNVQLARKSSLLTHGDGPKRKQHEQQHARGRQSKPEGLWASQKALVTRHRAPVADQPQASCVSLTFSDNDDLDLDVQYDKCIESCIASAATGSKEETSLGDAREVTVSLHSRGRFRERDGIQHGVSQSTTAAKSRETSCDGHDKLDATKRRSQLKSVQSSGSRLTAVTSSRKIASARQERFEAKNGWSAKGHIRSWFTSAAHSRDMSPDGQTTLETRSKGIALDGQGSQGSLCRLPRENSRLPSREHSASSQGGSGTESQCRSKTSSQCSSLHGSDSEEKPFQKFSQHDTSAPQPMRSVIYRRSVCTISSESEQNPDVINATSRPLSREFVTSGGGQPNKASVDEESSGGRSNEKYEAYRLAAAARRKKVLPVEKAAEALKLPLADSTASRHRSAELQASHSTKQYLAHHTARAVAHDEPKCAMAKTGLQGSFSRVTAGEGWTPNLRSQKSELAGLISAPTSDHAEHGSLHTPGSREQRTRSARVSATAGATFNIEEATGDNVGNLADSKISIEKRGKAEAAMVALRSAMSALQEVDPGLAQVCGEICQKMSDPLIHPLESTDANKFPSAASRNLHTLVCTANEAQFDPVLDHIASNHIRKGRGKQETLHTISSQQDVTTTSTPKISNSRDGQFELTWVSHDTMQQRSMSRSGEEPHAKRVGRPNQIGNTRKQDPWHNERARAQVTRKEPFNKSQTEGNRSRAKAKAQRHSMQSSNLPEFEFGTDEVLHTLDALEGRLQQYSMNGALLLTDREPFDEACQVVTKIHDGYRLNDDADLVHSRLLHALRRCSMLDDQRLELEMKRWLTGGPEPSPTVVNLDPWKPPIPDMEITVVAA